MTSDRPNFLFIMTDQLAAPALPFYGNPVAKTPRLSAMADRGVLFEQAYCNSPLCAPSRASLMTGQLPSRLGVYDNAAEFPAEIPTFAHYLRAAGYHTCLSGKMHFVGPDQLHGFEERLTTDIYPVDFGWTPDWTRPEDRLSWYHNMLSVVQAGLCQTSNQLDFDEEVAFQAVRKIYDLARSDDDRPFCLVASFTHPHDPFAITPEYWDRYRPSDIDMPAAPPIPYDQLDPHSRRLYHVCGMDQYRQTGDRVRNARHAYYAMISYIDDKVGHLLQALQNAGLSDNTIVIFASDHGEMLGERGLWYKMNFFEWSARVPLLFYAPGHFAPRRVAHPVSLVDILPTLVDLAGQVQASEYAAPLAGRSLTPFLHHTETDGDTNSVAGEFLAEGAIAPLVMIRRDRYKYVYSEPDPDQLYDLSTDPRELNNLAGRPDYEEIRAAFQAELLARWDLAGLHQAVLASQRRRRLVADALMAGQPTAWDFQPYRAASQRYMRNHLLLDDLERRARFPTPETPAPDQDR